MVFHDPTEVGNCEGYAFEEVGFAFKIAPIAIGAHGLHDSDHDIAPKMVVPGGFVERGGLERGWSGVGAAQQFVKIILEEFGAGWLRDVALGAVEERGGIVLGRASPPALIVNVVECPVVDHDVAGLEVTVYKEGCVGLEEEVDEVVEIVFEPFFVEGDVCEFEEIVFEVVEFPKHCPAVEFGAGECH